MLVHKQSIAFVTIGVAVIAVGVAASVRQAARPAPAASGTTFIVKDVRVFDGDKVIPRASVLVRDGLIAEVGANVHADPAVEVIAGEGRTLMPGLIDAHAHAFGDALERALVFGVTTELDMFTDYRFAAEMRAAQRKPGGAPGRADLWSAGTLVTVPGGHGTEYGMSIPTITDAANAGAFVDARIAEGSDYIKIIYDDGGSYGMHLPTVSPEILRAVVLAARRRGKLAVVHIGSQRGALESIEAGASGLMHIFADAPPDPAFVEAAVRARVFVVPTLTVTESTTGVAGGGSLVSDPRIAPFLTAPERSSLAASFPKRPGSKQDLQHALDAVRLLYNAGVPVLAGTDAPNPGTSHGAAQHRELELLVRAGLTPAAALAAATSVPARAFGLADRGRIAPGLRADLVLVDGDPTTDILATRRIAGVWKGGTRAERHEAARETTAPEIAITSGAISDFDGDSPSARFGAGWQVSTDSLLGGHSEAKMAIVAGGAEKTRGALEITGTIAAGAPYPWAGAMFFPAATPMSPVNLSRFKEIVFRTRGDGREYQVMMFAARLGNIPATVPFTAGPEWREVVMPFASFSNLDGSDLRGVLFSAGAQPGAFRFAIDDVRVR